MEIKAGSRVNVLVIFPLNFQVFTIHGRDQTRIIWQTHLEGLKQLCELFLGKIFVKKEKNT